MSSVATDLSDCLNCGAVLHGAHCAECGQKATAADPTFHDLLHEISHELFHVDGRLWQSITLLFTKPGFLTVEHREGRRARYAAPMRLYLTFSVLFFIANVYAPLEMSSKVDPKRGRVLHTGGLDISGDLLEGRTDLEVAEWVHKAEHEWLPRLMFVMVPVYALLVKAATRRQRRNYPQHLYFALHAHAAWFGVLTLSEVARFWRPPALSAWFWYPTVAIIVIYTAIAMHRVYGGGWIRSAWRTALTMFGYVSLLIVFTVALFLLLLRYSPDSLLRPHGERAAAVGLAPSR
jgi:hypothetical protein